ncbi:MAG: hypothetical protein PVI26_12535 [Chitinispirillia bacterium]
MINFICSFTKMKDKKPRLPPKNAIPSEPEFEEERKYDSTFLIIFVLKKKRPSGMLYLN